MPVRSKFLLWLLACSLPVQAATPDEAPGMEFLEYLGGLVEEEGVWMGPEEMEELMAAGETLPTNEAAEASRANTTNSDESEVTP